MKNIKFLQLFFFATLLFMGCEEDDVVLVETSHRAIVTSEMNFENTINPGGHIDFADISRGVKSRTWTFPEGLDVSRISGEDNNTSSKEVVKGFFFKPGVYNVVLSQVFNGNVYPNEDSVNPIEGVVLDTTIVVTVLDLLSSELQANYINDDGSLGAELNMSNNAENEINASKGVRLSYSSIGAPQQFIWDLPGTKQIKVENPGGPTDVVYSKLGTYDLQFITSRSRPTDRDTVVIKNFMKVLPSTDPVTIDKVFEVDDSNKNIGIIFSREMDPETVNRDDFSVEIETAGGAILNPTIKNVTVDPIDGSVLIVELDTEVMYNDDLVKVTYTPGNLSTLDFVKATTFTEELSEFLKTNIFEEEGSAVDYSFESSENANFPYLWWGGIWGEYNQGNNISFNNARTGDKSLYIDMNPNGGMIIGHTNASGDNVNFSVEGGFEYEIGVWVYVEELGNPSAGASPPDLRFYWRPGTNWGIPASATFSEGYATGEWVYASYKTEFSSSADISFMIRGFNEGNTGSVKFYMDDFALFKLTKRP